MPDEVVKDSLLSEFIARTGSDPAFAWDLLNGKQWDLEEGLRAYVELANIPDDQWSQVLDCSRKCNTVPICSSNVSISDVNKLPPPMHRGISRVEGNQNIVKKMQKRNRQNSGGDCSINSTVSDKSGEGTNLLPKPFPDACFSITIPDITVYPKGFKEYLERELVEKSTLIALQESGRLNWWIENGAAQPLYPMVTTGDGNCLLHAASLAMWGFHDRELVLRKALYAPLRDGSISLEPFKRRWRYSQTLINQQSGLIWSNEEWDKEWNCLLQLASYEPRKQPSTNNTNINNNNNRSTSSTEPVMDVAVEATETNYKNWSRTGPMSHCSSGSGGGVVTTLERQSNTAGSEDSMGSEQYESLEEFSPR